jgi:hypothetical protein
MQQIGENVVRIEAEPICSSDFFTKLFSPGGKRSLLRRFMMRWPTANRSFLLREAPLHFCTKFLDFTSGYTAILKYVSNANVSALS